MEEKRNITISLQEARERYCTLIKQYIKGSSIPVECTLKEQ